MGFKIRGRCNFKRRLRLGCLDRGCECVFHSVFNVVAGVAIDAKVYVNVDLAAIN